MNSKGTPEDHAHALLPGRDPGSGGGLGRRRPPRLSPLLHAPRPPAGPSATGRLLRAGPRLGAVPGLPRDRRPRSPGGPVKTPSWHLAFSGPHLLVVDDGESLRVPDGAQLAAALGADPACLADADGLVCAEVPLPSVAGHTCHAYDLPAGFEAPPGYGLLGLRALFDRIPPDLLRVAGTALQKVEWLRTHGFCSRCGSPTRRHPVHEAMECTMCGQLHFARLSPAVIVLVERDDAMRLAHSPRFPEGMYSTLAGFVEPGESLEEAIHREIREEVGVEVTDLRYFGSQPWPFPHSLMIGFTARWSGGEIRVDGEEVVDAGWFTASRLPARLPSGLSIARRLVEDFLRRHGGGAGGGGHAGGG
ncbi:MAG: NAD(+) diphosphatase [Gemmatimonadetes bacterium]|nr:NAD(+) diphosphatase [Gemmatimonadota bacterium]